MSHQIDTGAGMRLVAGHRGGGIIQNADGDIRFVENGIDNAGDTGCKEGGIADKSKCFAVVVDM